jgi:hypothetical protein
VGGGLAEIGVVVVVVVVVCWILVIVVDGLVWVRLGRKEVGGGSSRRRDGGRLKPRWKWAGRARRAAL